MNTKRAIDIVMGRLGNRTAPGLRTSVLDEMSIAQEQLEQAPELPWFIEVEEASAFTEVGETRLPLPTDFLREKEDFNLSIYIDDNLVDLVRTTYDEAEVQISRNAEPGTPQLYFLRNNYIVFRPAPDAVYEVVFPTYYGKQEPPADLVTSENAWFKNVPDLLMSMAGSQVAMKRLKDAELASDFLRDQKLAEDRLVRLMTARAEENRSRRMG